MHATALESITHEIGYCLGVQIVRIFWSVPIAVGIGTERAIRYTPPPARSWYVLRQGQQNINHMLRSR